MTEIYITVKFHFYIATQVGILPRMLTVQLRRFAYLTEGQHYQQFQWCVFWDSLKDVSQNVGCLNVFVEHLDRIFTAALLFIKNLPPWQLRYRQKNTQNKL